MTSIKYFINYHSLKSSCLKCHLYIVAIVHTFQDVLVTINFLGDSEFFSLTYAHDKAKNIFLYFFTKLKTDHFSYSTYKHDTIDIADPRSMQGEPHKSADSRKSEVQFLMGIQNFFFVPCSWKDEKHLSLFLYQAQNLLSHLFNYLSFCNNLFQLSSSAHKWWSWWTRNNKLGSCFVSASWLDYLLPLCMEGC